MIFLIFIIIPLIEIVIFISIGSEIGILNTIAIILFTALAGIFLIRKRGLSLLFNAQKNMSQGIMPTEEIKGGIFLLVSGLLLQCFLNLFKTLLLQKQKIISSQELDIKLSILPINSFKDITVL